LAQLVREHSNVKVGVLACLRKIHLQ
jgi:hypothetical protein